MVLDALMGLLFLGSGMCWLSSAVKSCYAQEEARSAEDRKKLFSLSLERNAEAALLAAAASLLGFIRIECSIFGFPIG